MPILPLRKLPDRPTRRVADAWLEQLEAALADDSTRPERALPRTLCEHVYPQYAGNWETAVEDESLPMATRLALAALDPRNITLEPEYYAECDDEKFQRVKPLLWLWYSFDRLPLGGQNVELGVKLRRMLAPYIFKRCGRNFKAFQYVEFSFGYNMEVGRQRRRAPSRAARRSRRASSWATTCRSATTRTSTATRTASSTSGM